MQNRKFYTLIVMSTLQGEENRGEYYSLAGAIEDATKLHEEGFFVTVAINDSTKVGDPCVWIDGEAC